ncbi:hypothetical protein J5N97_030146 [Dioscorea zingiberensis]|uniref:Uncharacterized protein n=1 Tax=Dioscorea zingiberensis TaxID=325984 RepID=A0A9D5BX50_9LILI|nr:hypothetical protein J5N97_030146 [Dioscorea zingiberensis]
MDLETENRLASMLMEEARRLRVQADKEGVHVYLQQPNVRSRPNSRFLSATVLGVQQANRAVEVSEMWRARDRELELDSRLRDRSIDSSSSRSEKRHSRHVERRLKSRHEEDDKASAALCSSNKRHPHEDPYPGKVGMGMRKLRNSFQSRTKRGRGAIGSRMDEPGPYLSASSNNHEQLSLSPDVRVKERWEMRIVGPEKPSFIQTKEHLNDGHNLTNTEADACLAKKYHSKKHGWKKGSKTKERKEGKRKHRDKKHKMR